MTEEKILRMPSFCHSEGFARSPKNLNKNDGKKRFFPFTSFRVRMTERRSVSE